MGKKGKGNKNDDDEFTMKEQVDDSKKFVSYKEQIAKEKKEAEKGMAKQSKNNDADSDSDEEATKKKSSKRNKKAQQEEAFGEEEQKNPEGEIEAAFEGMGKKNTRKKKTKEANLYGADDNLDGAFDQGADSDEIHEKKGKGSKKDKDRQQMKKDKKKKNQAEAEEEEENKEEAAEEQVVEEEVIEEEKPFMVNMVYCHKCTLPPEFCSYGQKDISECKKWLEATHPVLFKQIYKVEAQQTEVKEVKEAKEGKEGKEDDQIDSLKENEGAEPKPEKKKVVKFGKEKGIQGEIKVFKQHRGGKKVISQIVGLNHYTKDLKALAKQLGKKFSCGASVATDDQYGECVSVQGDVEERLIDLIETDKDLKLLEIPIEKITFDDTGNKKGRKRV